MATEVQSLENIPGLFAPQREFMIHNASDEPIELCYDGETFSIPPFNVVTAAHPKYPEVFCSGSDSTGKKIPGTLVIRDVIEARAANSDQGNGCRGDRWDAAKAVRHCLGVDLKTKKPTSRWYDRGISLLPMEPAPDLVAATQKLGRARWEAFRLEQDRQYVNAVMQSMSKHKALGLFPTPPGGDFEAAQARLRAAAESGIVVKDQAPSLDAKEGMVQAILEDQDFLALLKEKLASAAKKPVAKAVKG